MNTILQIKNELNRLGLSENHERVTKFLVKAGATCLEALSDAIQGGLLRQLQGIETPEDLGDLLAELSAVCDSKGISLDGLWVQLWLTQNGFESRRDLDVPDLIRLIDTIKRCQPDTYTIPIKRELAEIRGSMMAIIDILQEWHPQDTRIATLKAKISTSPYGSTRSSL